MSIVESRPDRPRPDRRSDRSVGRTRDDAATRPLVGVLCCNRSVDGRRAQTVATRFVEPLARLSDASVLLVPAAPEALEAPRLARTLDALLLTGSCSNVARDRYGAAVADPSREDRARDDVAFRLAGAMIEAGRPVFGICRGMQEINVLFGGTLSDAPGDAGHHRSPATEDTPLARLFAHRHAVDVAAGGPLGAAIGAGRHLVNSVHRQGVERLGGGLRVEARAPDALVEAVSAPGCGAPVLGVQWHPEWDADDNPDSRAFFALLGRAARDGRFALAA